MAVSSIEEVLEDIKAGKMIILVDDEDRENEGDLYMAAEDVDEVGITNDGIQKHLALWYWIYNQY